MLVIQIFNTFSSFIRIVVIQEIASAAASMMKMWVHAMNIISYSIKFNVFVVI